VTQMCPPGFYKCGATDETSQFDNLWIGSVVSAVGPCVPLLIMRWLIPDARQTDRLLPPDEAQYGRVGDNDDDDGDGRGEEGGMEVELSVSRAALASRGDGSSSGSVSVGSAAVQSVSGGGVLVVTDSGSTEQSSSSAAANQSSSEDGGSSSNNSSSNSSNNSASSGKNKSKSSNSNSSSNSSNSSSSNNKSKNKNGSISSSNSGNPQAKSSNSDVSSIAKGSTTNLPVQKLHSEPAMVTVGVDTASTPVTASATATVTNKAVVSTNVSPSADMSSTSLSSAAAATFDHSYTTITTANNDNCHSAASSNRNKNRNHGSNQATETPSSSQVLSRAQLATVGAGAGFPDDVSRLISEAALMQQFQQQQPALEQLLRERSDVLALVDALVTRRVEKILAEGGKAEEQTLLRVIQEQKLTIQQLQQAAVEREGKLAAFTRDLQKGKELIDKNEEARHDDLAQMEKMHSAVVAKLEKRQAAAIAKLEKKHSEALAKVTKKQADFSSKVEKLTGQNKAQASQIAEQKGQILKLTQETQNQAAAFNDQDQRHTATINQLRAQLTAAQAEVQRTGHLETQVRSLDGLGQLVGPQNNEGLNHFEFDIGATLRRRMMEDMKLQMQVGPQMQQPNLEPAPAKESARKCEICQRRDKDCTFSCGHQTCMSCGSQLTACPTCREPIRSRVRTFV